MGDSRVCLSKDNMSSFDKARVSANGTRLYIVRAFSFVK